MKLWKIAVPVLMLTCLASIASAAMMQGTAAPMKGQFTISGMGGVEVPTADLSDKAKGDQGAGWGAGGSVDYFFTDQIALGADFMYFATKSKDPFEDPVTLLPEDLKAKTMEYGVHAKWFMPTGGGKLMPWLGVGIGAANRKLEIGSTSDNDTKLAVYPGVGVNFAITSMVDLGVNGMYHFTSGKFKESDVNWQFISFGGVLTFHIPHSSTGGGMK